MTALPYTGASSPLPPEPENLEPEHIQAPLDTLLPCEEHETTIDPENEPVPIWPLPTRVFPVQSLPRIPTGNAPAQSLEKKTPPVRSWRQAQREIRGIAGGRWFVRAWIGEKESEYSTWKSTMNVPAVVPVASKKLKFLKPDTGERPNASISGASTPGLVPEISVQNA